MISNNNQYPFSSKHTEQIGMQKKFLYHLDEKSVYRATLKG